MGPRSLVALKDSRRVCAGTWCLGILRLDWTCFWDVKNLFLWGFLMSEMKLRGRATSVCSCVMCLKPPWCGRFSFSFLETLSLSALFSTTSSLRSVLRVLLGTPCVGDRRSYFTMCGCVIWSVSHHVHTENDHFGCLQEEFSSFSVYFLFYHYLASFLVKIAL